MPHTLRSVFSSRRLRNGLVAVVTTVAVMAGALIPALPASAQSPDSAVLINVNGYPGSIGLYTTGHTLGTCGSSITASSNSTTTCVGIQFGTPDGMTLRLTNVPSGYNFNGITMSGYPTEGSAGCSSYCYFNFSKGSVTLNFNFSPAYVYYPPAPTPPPTQPAPPAPSTPAAPVAPQASITGRGTHNLQVSWSTGSTPGGFNRYEVWQGNSLLWSTTNANWRSYNQTNLTCGGASYSYNVRIYDNQGRYASSNTASSTTQACPTASTGGGSSSTGSTTVSSSSSSSNRTARTSTARSTSSTNNNGGPRLPNTGDSAVVPEGGTLGSVDGSDLLSSNVSSTNTSRTDRIPERGTNKKGLSNLEAIVLGMLSVVLLAGIVRYLYVKQVAKQSSYWS